jgi:hypothetical protein
LKYTIECEICHIKIDVIRAIYQKIPRFCGNKCRGQGVKQWLKRKFIWKNSSKEEIDNHINEYFEKKIIRKEGCWDWKSSKNDKEYQRMHISKLAPRIAIHIYSWKLYKGEIPEGMFVCHSCDNKRCANPDHLFLGTSDDNIQDMINKKRNVRGVSHGMAKLDDDKVKEIRKLLEIGVSLVKTANKFNVSKKTVFRIKHKTHWKHV